MSIESKNLYTATNSGTSVLCGAQADIDAINAKYEKPEDGIPKTDLDASVQTSLGRADTALQQQAQANWEETDATDPAFINNKPNLDNFVPTHDTNEGEDQTGTFEYTKDDEGNISMTVSTSYEGGGYSTEMAPTKVEVSQKTDEGETVHKAELKHDGVYLDEAGYKPLEIVGVTEDDEEVTFKVLGYEVQ